MAALAVSCHGLKRAESEGGIMKSRGSRAAVAWKAGKPLVIKEVARKVYRKVPVFNASRDRYPLTFSNDA